MARPYNRKPVADDIESDAAETAEIPFVSNGIVAQPGRLVHRNVFLTFNVGQVLQVDRSLRHAIDNSGIAVDWSF